MKSRKHLVTLLLSCQFLAFSPLGLKAQDASTRVTLEKGVITLHAPAIVDITIDNFSSGTLHFDPGYDQERIDIMVVDPDGQVLKKQSPAPHEGMRFSQALDVTPGTASISFVLLNDWFPFEKTGNYQIEVKIPSPSGSRSKEGGEQRSNLTLTLLPRDRAALESTCEELVKRIKDSHSASAALVAARGLAGVDDPIAVPFLAEAARQRPFAGLMVTALARLKTEEAVRVLVTVSKSSDPETSKLAHSALEGLRVIQHR